MYNKKKLPKYQDAFDNIIFNPNQNNTRQSQFNYNQESPWQLPQNTPPNPYNQNTYEVGSPNLPMDNTFGNRPQVNLPPSTEMYSWADDPQNLRKPFDNKIPEGNMPDETKERQPFFPNLYNQPYSGEHAYNAGALSSMFKNRDDLGLTKGQSTGAVMGAVGSGLMAGLGSLREFASGFSTNQNLIQAEQERQTNVRRNLTGTGNEIGEQKAFNQGYMRTTNNVRGLDGGMFKNNPFSMQEGGAIESVIANDITAEPTNPNTNVEVEKGEVVIDPNTNDVRLVQGQTHQQTDEYKGQEYSGVPTEFQGGEMVISNNGKVDKKTAKEFGVPKAKTYAELVTKHPIQKEIDKINEKIAEWTTKSEKYLDETEDQAKATTNSRNLEFISGKINDLEQEIAPLKEEILGISMSVYEMQEQAKADGSYEGIKPPIEEQEQMQEGGEMEAIAQEVATMLQQGADPEQVLAQLIEAGVPQQEAEQLVMMVMEQIQGQQPQIQEQQMMQEGGQQDPTMELLMTFAQLTGMGEQEFEQLVAELQNLPPEQMEQALMEIEQQVIQAQQPQQEMFAQNPYSQGEQAMQDGGRGSVRNRRGVEIPPISTQGTGYNFPTTIEDGENVVDEDYSNVETIQSSRGKGYYGKKSVDLDQAKNIHSWYFDNKKDFDLTKKEDVKDFQKSYNKEIERRAKEAGLSDKQVEEQVKKYGFTSSNQGVNQIDGMWGAYTSTRPLPIFKKEEVGEEVIVKAEDEVTGQEISEFDPGDWNPQSKQGVSGLLYPRYSGDMIAPLYVGSLQNINSGDLSPLKTSWDKIVQENQKQNAFTAELLAQNIGVPDNFSASIANENRKAITQVNEANAQRQYQTDMVNLQNKRADSLQNSQFLRNYEDRYAAAIDNTIRDLNTSRYNRFVQEAGILRDDRALKAYNQANPNYNFGESGVVYQENNRTPNLPENMLQAQLMYGSNTKKEKETQDGGRPIKRKFKFKPKKK